MLDLGLFKDACPTDWEPAGSSQIDVREGCRGDTIRFCKKMGTDTEGLQAVYVLDEGNGALCPPEHKKMTYQGAEYDLNTGCGGSYIYGCLKKGKAPFLKDVVVLKNQPTYANYTISSDLKKGTGGKTPSLYFGTLEVSP